VNLLMKKRHRLLIAFQPIFNRGNDIIGYEAMPCCNPYVQLSSVSDTVMQMMSEDWMHNGINELTREYPLFLKCTCDAMLCGLPLGLPNSSVLEIPETANCNGTLAAACQTAKSHGYHIAINSFRHSTATDGLIEMADYIKFNFCQSDRETRKIILNRAGEHGILLIADNISTAEDCELAFEEGFQFVQGHYFAPCELWPSIAS
jgi:c-di-GMP-related signal transduction protein